MFTNIKRSRVAFFFFPPPPFLKLDATRATPLTVTSGCQVGAFGEIWRIIVWTLKTPPERLVQHNPAAARWRAELSLSLRLADAEEQVVRWEQTTKFVPRPSETN